MMRRIGFLALVLGLFFGGPVSAKAADGEYKLQKVEMQLLEGDKACGPYFVETTFGGRSAKTLIFHFLDEKGKLHREAIGLSKVSVVLDNEKEIPTVHYGENDDGEKIAEIKISKKNQAEASCLPQPKKQEK